MADPTIQGGRPLKILHILRAPLGGLFRHVLDLARGQVARGHAVGIVADASTGGADAQRQLGDIEPGLVLGLTRLPMRRDPHVSDAAALVHVLQRVARANPDVVHGHGSKGGVYARGIGLRYPAHGPICVYTPHGGSLNYRASPWKQKLFMAAERLMAWRTDLLLFESAFIAGRYTELVGPPRGLSRVIHNGIGAHEFQKVRPRPDAAEFLYVGELRAAKGIDTLIDALAAAGVRMASAPRAILVGSGPDKDALLAHAARRGLQDRIEFAGILPARQAFERGQILVVPSRAESLPYIVLEAAGACIPMIATAVGGIPEIFGPYRDRLIAADDPARLADRMIELITTSQAQRAAGADDLARHVRQCFSIETMVEDVLDAYRQAVSRRAQGAAAAPQRVALSS